MKNYFSIYNLPQDASLEEIKGILNKELRKWTSRATHPKLEIRQEAELNIKNVSEAIKVFETEESKNAYINQLNIELNKAKNNNQGRQNTQSNTQNKGGNLSIDQSIKQAYELVNMDKNKALSLAQNIASQAPNYEPAWIALSKIQAENNVNQDILFKTYNRIMELNPNNYEINYLYLYGLLDRASLFVDRDKKIVEYLVNNIKRLNPNSDDTIFLECLYLNYLNEHEKTIDLAKDRVEHDSRFKYPLAIAYYRLAEIKYLVRHEQKWQAINMEDAKKYMALFDEGKKYYTSEFFNEKYEAVKKSLDNSFIPYSFVSVIIRIGISGVIYYFLSKVVYGILGTILPKFLSSPIISIIDLIAFYFIFVLPIASMFAKGYRINADIVNGKDPYKESYRRKLLFSYGKAKTTAQEIKNKVKNNE